MEQLKKISYYTIISGFLGICFVFEFTAYETYSMIPLFLIGLGSFLYLYSDTKIRKHFTKRNISFLIFIVSFSILYTLTFIIPDYADAIFMDSINIIILIILCIPMIVSLIYLCIHSKLVRQFFSNLC